MLFAVGMQKSGQLLGDEKEFLHLGRLGHELLGGELVFCQAEVRLDVLNIWIG